MNILKSTAVKWGGLIASAALILGVASSNAACLWWYHQPKVPQGMAKFKKS